MKAAVLRAPHAPMEIEEVQVAKPGPREVLVRTVATGLCHSDLHYLDGHYATPLPTILGHETAGIVEQVGEGVIGLAPGDRVIACLSVFCGHCRHCVSGRPYACASGETERPADAPPRLSRGSERLHQFYNLSAFAEQLLVHEHALVRIDREEMPLDRAALIGCGVTTGVGAVINTAKVEPGANCVVFGLGGIGLNVIQGLRLAGANMIVGVDLNDDKKEWGERFGMTHFVNPSKVEGDLVAHLVELTRGGADYSFECIGNTKVMRQALECAHKGWGQSIIIGVAGAGQEISTRPFQLVTGRSWRGTAFGGARGRTDVPKIVDWYMQGKIEIDPMITHILPLERINEGFDLMHEGKSIRSVVVY